MIPAPSNNKTLLLIASSMVLALAMVVSAWLLSKFLVKVQRETTISAKGYAEKAVMSDLGSFTATVSVQSQNLADGYNQITAHTERVKKMVESYGFVPHEIVVEAISYNKAFQWIDGRETNNLLYYYYSQTIRICTKNVALIADNYRKLNELLGQNIQISISSPEFFISDPESYKLELTQLASQSARSRAEIMAKEGGAELHKLLSARLGVIQINRPASSEMSDYGVYDTSSPEKVIKIVVALEFSTR